MSSVDNRIVNMTFNNKDFERNAAQSTKTLDGLERSLANTGKSKGLSSFGDGVSQVSSKFSAMQVIGVTALATITSKAVSAGLNIVKSLTIAPLVQGFQEYQTNLNSTQTIISNTGESVKTVGKYLKKLNNYSDRTIYNFSEMARNIGTFTAAGVDLDTATNSIKGIANLAALSGSNSQQASTAMYQLSQAIAAGRVGLQDWNSVVNAGMGGKIFQTALSRTAVNMGKLTDGAAKLNKETGQLTVNGESFRQSISSVGGGSSWLDGVTLTETLKQISGAYTEAQLKAKGYTDAQVKEIKHLATIAFNAATKIKTAPQLLQVVQESVGSIFANSFSLILGNFQQSKKLWTNIGATIVGPFGILTKIGNGVSKTLKGWVKEGGRNKMLAGMERALKNVWRLFVPFKNAFQDIFPSTGNKVQGLVRVTQAFKDFANFLKPSVKTMHQLRDIFRGVFAVLHIGFTIVKGIAGAFGALFGALFKNAGPGRDGILEIAAALGRSLVALDKFITQGGKFQDVLKNIGGVAGAVLGPLIKIIGAVGTTIVEAFTSLSLGNISGSIKNIQGLFLDLAQNAVSSLRTLFSPIDALDGFFDGLYVKVRNLRSIFYMKNSDFFGGSGGIGQAQETISSGMDKIGDSATKVTGKLSDGFGKVSEVTDKAKDSVTGMFDVVSGTSGQAATNTTEGISDAAGTASTGIQRLKDLLSGVASGIGTAFSHLGDTFSWVNKQFSDLFGNFDGMDWVAFFNAIFSGALILTLRNFAKNFGGMGKAIKDTFGELTNTLKSMQSAIKARAIRDIAIAVGILAASMLVLSLLDVKTLGKSLGAVASILAILVASLKAMSKISAGNLDLLSLSASLLIISNAMLQLAIAVAVFGNMDIDTLARGLGGMATALALMVAAVNTLSGIEGALKSAAFGIILMSGAMIILAAAVLAFGKMKMKTLAKGLGAMAVALGLMVGAMIILGKESVVIEGSAAAILIISGAMLILSTAIGRFGKMNMEQLAKGFGAMAVGLALMVGALLILSGAGPAALFGAGAMLLMAIALEKIALVIIALGLAPWKLVAVGIGFVALALGVLLAAGAIAMLIAPGLIALGIAVALLGAGMLLAGAGMALFGAGFAVFAAAGVAGTAIIIAAFHAFLALLPELAVQLAASLVAFLKALANAAPKIRKSIGTIIENMLGIVRDAIPEIGAVFSALINEALRILEDSGPEFIKVAFDLLTAFLSELDGHITEIVETVASIVEKFIRAFGKKAGDLAEAGIDMIIDMLHGMADAIDAKHNALFDAIDDVARALANALKDAFQHYLGDIDFTSIIAAALPGGAALEGLINPRTGGFGKTKSPAEILIDTIKDSAKLVRETMDSVLVDILKQNYPQKIIDAALKLTASQINADKLAERVDTLDRGATFAEKQAEKAKEKADKLKEEAKKKNATKKDKADAAKAKKHADKLAAEAKRKRARADIQPSIADFAAQKVGYKTASLQSSKDLFDAVQSGDLEGAGDVKAAQAQDLVDRSKEMLAKSQADQKLADKLAKGNKKERELATKMRKQAQDEAEKAGAWAQEARDAMDLASKYYRDAAQQRMEDIIAQHNQAAKDLADQQAYDKANTSEKAAIMQKRAEDSKAKAAQAEAAYLAAIAAAEAALAAGDTQLANAQLNLAEQQAAIAAQAAQDASDQAAQAAQLADQAKQEAEQAAASGGSSGGASNVNQPSRTALEDAAKSVDRFTQSLFDSEAAAQAGQPVLQFVQTNTSPVALTASEIYRQTNNLLSLAQAKNP